MGLVRVYNDNKFPHREMFRDRQIEIEPGAYVVMDEGEAIQFRGQYTPIKTDGTGRHLPEYFKIIRLAPHSLQEVPKGPEPKKFVCQLDGREFDSQEALDQYVLDNHTDKIEDQEFAKEFVKKGRGRPRKEQ